MITKRCFVLMPSRPDLDDVYAVIKDVTTGLGLECWRGSELQRPGNVLGMILADIERADIIIADLTGGNPNVFYETAVAHCRKSPQQVILIAQSDDDVPFDLRALRYLKYTNNALGRKALRKPLADYFQQALASSPDDAFEMIEGKIERTRRLVADCDALLESGDAVIRSLLIRTRAGLSCLAITDKELLDVKGEKERRYKRLLLAERDRVMDLIRRGATFRAVLTPPTGRRMLHSHLRLRYKQLIELVEAICQDSRHPLRTCRIALFPLLGNNVLILGERVVYEGTKIGLRGGFELTMRMAHPALVVPHARGFDLLFKDAVSHTLASWGRTSKRQDARLWTALLRGLKEGYQEGEVGQHRSDKRARRLRRARAAG